MSRKICLLRGAQGAGKSTWIKENNLEQYTLSPDTIRVMCSSLELQSNGEFKISQNQRNEQEVWSVLFKLLEHRMSRGEFTVIDATCSKTSDIKQYKDLADQYRYRMFIVDFTDIPLETCLVQNKLRPEWKQVPNEAIRKIYARFETQKIPSGVKIIKRDELNILLEQPIDLSNYSKIVFIGDIHGCYDTLMQYPDFKDGLKDDVEYIFLGDFIDRGNQNVEVLNFINSIKDKPNVCLLEGNHECFTKDTLFLTRNGWKLYDDITDVDELAQVDLKTNLVSFAKPISRIEKISNEVFDLSNYYVKQSITLNHNIVYKEKLVPLSSLDLSSLRRQDFKTAVNSNFFGLTFSAEFLELLFWIIADGTIVYGEKGHPNNHKCRVQFRLARQDKITELSKLLEKNNIKYSITDAPTSGVGKLPVKVIRFYGDDARKCYNILGKDKNLPWKFIFMNNEQWNKIKYLLSKTDGSIYGERISYTSINLENLKIIQTLAVLHGDMAILNKRRAGGFSKKDQYLLTIYLNSKESKGRSSRVSVRKAPTQSVCCFQMPLGTLITKKDNNIVISGNCYLQNYGNDIPSKSKEFEQVTRKELINKEFDKKTAREIYRKLRQFSHFTYNGLEVLACHGGIPNLKTNLLYLPTRDFIHGVGQYSDYLTIADTWMKDTKENQYLVHGHRNTEGTDIDVADRVFNLEGRVEFGGKLRLVELTKDLKWNYIYLDSIQPIIHIEEDKRYEELPILEQLRNNRFIQEKDLGNDISSFNFTREAFYEANWNNQTILARGLFLNNKTGDIVARSYEKFFKINEVRKTELASLKESLVFPVKVYVKENGYLGIVSYLEDKDELFVATKSTNKGDFANWFNTLLEPYKEKIKQLFKTNHLSNQSLVFEVIDKDNDPHIIEYENSKIVLLDIITNSFNFEKVGYWDLRCYARNIGCEVKKLAFELKNWDEFRTLYYATINYDYKYLGDYIEGYVFEDSNRFMVKVKSGYYDEWKKLRGVANMVLKCGYLRRTGMLTNELENFFYGFLKEVYSKYYNKDEKSYPIKTDIISLRKMFEDSK